jgi:hypothetical protein
MEGWGAIFSLHLLEILTVSLGQIQNSYPDAYGHEHRIGQVRFHNQPMEIRKIENRKSGTGSREDPKVG